jgi:hypothetical protein
MNYLKTFESFDFDLHKGKLGYRFGEIIEDRLQELNDMGYSITAKEYSGYPFCNLIIRISKWKNRCSIPQYLDMDIIVDNLVAMSDDLSVDGLRLVDCTVDHESNVNILPLYKEVKDKNGFRYFSSDSLYKLEEITHKIFNIDLTFKRNKLI